MWSLPELFDAARRLWLPCVAGGLLAQAVSPASKTEAAEIHLHSEFRTDGGLVFLRDVADVYAADPAQVKILGDIDLIAAPPDGQKRFLPLREIQDLLVLRGVNLREQRFTGASQVKIVGVIEGHTAPERHLPAVPVKQTNDTVRQAILRYLNDREPDIDSWSVKFSLDDDQARLIAANTKGLAIEGGRKPWTGAQSFTVALAVGSKTVRLPINAEVTLPPMIVVATQSLGKGAIVRPADVRLQPGQANPGSARTFSAVEDVIGKEVTKQIAEGQILDDSVVRPQVLVHRGEIVTVYARTAGIQVRVSARARDDGAQGELITVESLTKRENYFARVTAPQTCDVFAHAMTAAEDVDARPANADRLTAFRRASAKNRAVPVNAQSPANAQSEDKQK